MQHMGMTPLSFQRNGGNGNMSRRAHFESDYIEWLKSMRCVVYLPLSSNGDLKDYISGVLLTITGYGSMVWDSNENMYKITSPSQTNRGTAFLSSFKKSLLTTNSFSVLMEEKMITNSSSKWHNQISTPCSSNSYNDYLTCTTSASTTRTDAFPRDLVKLAKTYDSNYEIGYVNGEQIRKVAVTGTSGLPSNWVTTGDGLYISFPATSTKTSVQFYISNIYIFNGVIDLQTIRKIQDYE